MTTRTLAEAHLSRESTYLCHLLFDTDEWQSASDAELAQYLKVIEDGHRIYQPVHVVNHPNAGRLTGERAVMLVYDMQHLSIAEFPMRDTVELLLTRPVFSEVSNFELLPSKTIAAALNLIAHTRDPEKVLAALARTRTLQLTRLNSSPLLCAMERRPESGAPSYLAGQEDIYMPVAPAAVREFYESFPLENVRMAESLIRADAEGTGEKNEWSSSLNKQVNTRLDPFFDTMLETLIRRIYQEQRPDMLPYYGLDELRHVKPQPWTLALMQALKDEKFVMPDESETVEQMGRCIRAWFPAYAEMPVQWSLPLIAGEIQRHAKEAAAAA